ncbi:MAG: acyl carrier protein [Gammaproteobacteria bacterium]|nr:acyl carrier protein [Gammaproteobacteria bacterium]
MYYQSKVQSIGAEQNFYDLGGDSLAIIKIIASLKGKYNKFISFNEFGCQKTLSKIAGHIINL